MDVSTRLKRLLELKQLYESGVLTKEEMESEKAKILSGVSEESPQSSSFSQDNSNATDTQQQNLHTNYSKDEKPTPSSHKNRRNEIIIGIVVIVLIGGLIYAVWPKGNNSNNNLESEPRTEIVKARAPIGLKGVVGDNIGFSMRLHFDGSAVSGSEHYDGQPSEATLRIEGSIDANDNLTLYEYDGSEQTGFIQGTLSGNSFTGTFQGKKTLPIQADVMTLDELQTAERQLTEYSTYRVSYTRSTADAEVEVAIDYPKSGNPKLMANIQQLIIDALTETFNWGTPNPRYTGDASDGQAIANYYGDYRVKALTKERKEEQIQSKLDESISILNAYETDKLVSYEVIFGGGHGGVGDGCRFGATFRKSDGQRIEPITALKDPNLKNFLIQTIQDDFSDRIYMLNESFYSDPVPAANPYIMANGLKFVYQKYEIGPGGLGQIEKTFSLQTMWPYMTKEAKALVK